MPCKYKYRTPANAETKCTLGNVIQNNDYEDTVSVVGTLVSTPADPNSAVGLTRVVSMVNRATSVVDKKTGERLSLTSFDYPFGSDNFFNWTPVTEDSSGLFDPVVLYDEFSDRFFCVAEETIGLADSELSIDSPGGIAGTYPANKGFAGPQVFNLSGENIVPADPLNADTPLVNGAAIAGNIALVASDNFATGSVNKGQNCRDAGAIGMIIYNSTIDLLDFITGDAVIPSIFVGKDIGEAILANLPVVGGMRNLAVTEIGANAYSNLHIAVSKDGSPNTKDDFYIYTLGGPSGIFDTFRIDYPKMGVDESALYFTIYSGQYPPSAQNTVTAYDQLVAVEKAPLLAGPSGTAPTVLLNHLKLLNANEPLEGSTTNAFVELRVPSLLRPPKSDIQQVAYFVNTKLFDPLVLNPVPASGDTLVVTAVTDILGTPQIQTFEIGVDPFTAPHTSTNTSGFNQTVPQIPGPFASYGYAVRLALLNAPITRYRVIHYKNSLWCALESGNTDLYEVRWYEIDGSGLFDSTPTVVLRQEGKIQPGDGISAFYPSLDVDRDGNMGIGFNISGENQPVAIAHTGRLCDDPLGTVRFPLQINFAGPDGIPYYDSSYDYYNGNSRWNDYTSTVLDPEDGKTFWHFNQYNNNTIENYYYLYMRWNTALVNFCVEDKEGKEKTTSGIKPKPESNCGCIKTLRVVSSEKSAPKSRGTTDKEGIQNRLKDLTKQQKCQTMVEARRKKNKN